MPSAAFKPELLINHVISVGGSGASGVVTSGVVSGVFDEVDGFSPCVHPPSKIVAAKIHARTAFAVFCVF